MPQPRMKLYSSNPERVRQFDDTSEALNLRYASVKAAVLPYITDRLVEIAKQARQATQGAFILGELEGYRAFRSDIVNRLKAKGWPVLGRSADGSWQRTEENQDHLEGLDKILDRITESYYNKDGFATSLSLTFARDNDRPDIDAFKSAVFLSREDNLNTLVQAVQESIDEFQKTYGNPFLVKHYQRSFLRAAFDAVCDHIKPAKTFESQSIKTFKTLLETMREFSSRSGKECVPGIEFQGRMEDVLRDKGWPIPKDGLSPLRERLWTLASAAEVKTTLPIRIELQNETEPPQSSIYHSQQYILSHLPDIEQARIQVKSELDQESKNLSGYTPRHFQWG